MEAGLPMPARPPPSELAALRERLKVKIETTTIDGVKVYIVTPETIPPENRNRLLVHMHGGCYVLNPRRGGAAARRSTWPASARFKVISVDYRMPPDASYPAALDDAMAVWKAALKMADPEEHGDLRHVRRRRADAVDGAAREAGRAAAARRDRARHADVGRDQGRRLLPRPTRWSTTCWSSTDGFCDAARQLYANGHDLKDPLLSPVYGDMHGFPPTILTTGTRDLLLSNTVRVHRKLRQAGVEAELHVFEGQSHAQYMRDANAPETKEAFEEIAQFFDKHLGRRSPRRGLARVGKCTFPDLIRRTASARVALPLCE